MSKTQNIAEKRQSVEAARERSAGELEALRAERRRLAPDALAGDPRAEAELAGVDGLIGDAEKRLQLAEEAGGELDRLEAEEKKRREDEERAVAEVAHVQAAQEASLALDGVDDVVTELAGAMRAAVSAAGKVRELEGAVPEDGRGDRETCDALEERVVARLVGHLRHLREGDGDLRSWLESAREGLSSALEEAGRTDPDAPFLEPSYSSEAELAQRGSFFEAADRANHLRERIAEAEYQLGILSHPELVQVINARPIGYSGRRA